MYKTAYKLLIVISAIYMTVLIYSCNNDSVKQASISKSEELFRDIEKGEIPKQFHIKYFPLEESKAMINKLKEELCFEMTKGKLNSYEFISQRATEEEDYTVLDYRFTLKCSDITIILRYAPNSNFELREFYLKENKIVK